MAAGESAIKPKSQEAENRYCWWGRVLGKVTPFKEPFKVRSDIFLSPELSHTPYLAARETGNVVSWTVATPIKISVLLLKSKWKMITDLPSMVASLPQVASGLQLQNQESVERLHSGSNTPSTASPFTWLSQNSTFTGILVKI